MAAADPLGELPIWALTIKAIRARHRWGVREAARHAGISPSYLCQLEKGERRPSREVGESIIRGFGMSPRIAAGVRAAYVRTTRPHTPTRARAREDDELPVPPALPGDEGGKMQVSGPSAWRGGAAPSSWPLEGGPPQPTPVDQLPQIDEGPFPHPAGPPAPIADHEAGHVRYRCGRCGALLRDPNRDPVEHTQAWCDEAVERTERMFAEQDEPKVINWHRVRF